MRSLKLVMLIFVGVMFISFVSAQGFGNFGSVDQFITAVIGAVERIFQPIFKALLKEDKVTEPIFFSKILLLILLFSIISMVLKRVSLFGGNKKVAFIVSGIVSLLGVRYIGDNGIIEGILLPYGTLAVAITTFLPFMIYFWWVHESGAGPFGRKAAWILYGIIFILFSWTRRDQLSGFSETLYLFGIAAVAIAAFFDSSIHQYFGHMKMEQSTEAHKDDLRIAIKVKMGKLGEAWKSGLISDAEYNKAMNRYKQQYKSI